MSGRAASARVVGGVVLDLPVQMSLFQARPDRWVRRWSVRSETAARQYVVACDQQGGWGCSCPGWVYHSPRRPCKHIAAVRGGGAC